MKTNARSIHVSWLVAWFAAGIIGGIAVSLVVNSPLPGIQLIILAAVSAFMVLFVRNRWAILIVLIAGLLLGISCGGALQTSLHAYEAYYDRQVVVSGRVHEDTSLGKRGEIQIRLTDVSIGTESLPGNIWLSTNSTADIKRGDYAKFRGKLKQGFGNLPASMFQAELVSLDRKKFQDVPREIRDWFAEGIRLAIAEPEASLGAGYLLGQHSVLPEDLDNQLLLLGLTHVVVASGYNLTILVRFARKAFASISKYLAALAASGMILTFVLMTGFSPSMTRAALVAGLSLLAWYFGRNFQPVILLALVGAVTAWINPSYVWGDIGWYLSFASFAGIMLLAPLVTHYFWGVERLGPLRRIFIETMSAQIATLPIIAFIFGQYSPLSIPANMLILPLVPLAMALTFVAGLGGIGLPFIAHITGFPATLLLQYMTHVTSWLSGLPWANGEVIFSLQHLIISYIGLLLICLYLRRKTRHNFGRDNVVI